MEKWREKKMEALRLQIELEEKQLQIALEKRREEEEKEKQRREIEKEKVRRILAQTYHSVNKGHSVFLVSCFVFIFQL